MRLWSTILKTMQSKKLDEAGLPVKLADIINYSTKETAEASLDHIIKNL